MKNRKICLSLNRDLSALAHPDLGRRISVTGMIFVLLGLVLLLHACEPAGGIKERESMSVIKKNCTASMDKQPMDAPVQAKIKTATFALG
jgi:Na+-transporting methylmalonyl-CoA/oxaloacetate decarboxylase gamma subunit